MSKKQTTNNDHHLDPPRHPHLINPLEESMKRDFKAVLKKMTIDITKQLTEEFKQH